MNIAIIDGQGGGLGKQLVEALLKSKMDVELTAIGTNSLATNAMIKAGAKQAATGENAVIVACRHADVIVGALGIAIADSLFGEITPSMAMAVGQSEATKILIPMNMCNNIVVGVTKQPMAQLIEDAIGIIRQLDEG
ncbi:MAG: DUF3842 family protein [Acetatifactor sp.]|nr:DUF3842 family protein [Acetatifactor sp.]